MEKVTEYDTRIGFDEEKKMEINSKFNLILRKLTL